MNTKFFMEPSEFRAWLEEHYEHTLELWVGFYKKHVGKPGITWPEAVKEAICFGWIDGIRKSLDDASYAIRFTPRKPRSIWSAVNIQYAHDLIRQGLMHPAGLKAFEERSEQKSVIYAYEQKDGVELGAG